MVVLLDAVQILNIAMNLAVIISQKKHSHISFKLENFMGTIVISAYLLLTMLLWKTSIKTDYLTLLTCTIFLIHQMHAFVRIDPITSLQKQPEFRGESLQQLYAFIAMMGTFLPMKNYLVPVIFLYAGV